MKQLFKNRNGVVDLSSNQPQTPHLVKNVYTESPDEIVYLYNVSEVRAAGFLKNLAVAFVHELVQNSVHFVFVNRTAIESLKRSGNAKHRRTPNFEMQVAALAFNQGAEQTVNFVFFFPNVRGYITGF